MNSTVAGVPAGSVALGTDGVLAAFDDAGAVRFEEITRPTTNTITHTTITIHAHNGAES